MQIPHLHRLILSYLDESIQAVTEKTADISFNSKFTIAANETHIFFTQYGYVMSILGHLQ